MDNILGIIFLATFTEGIIEYLFSDETRAQPYLKYLALLTGVGLAVAYNVDLLALVGLTTTVPLVSNVVSGVMIGRGSNYINDVLSAVRGKSA